MKTFKTLLVLVISLFSFASFAQQNYGTIGSFSISSSNLINNKVKIDENSSTTTVSYTVSISRSADYSTSNGWKPVDIIISLGSKNSNGVPIYFPTSYRVTGADFPANSGFLTKTLTSVINKASLATGQLIVLAFTTPDFPFTQAWSNPTYGFQIGNGATVPPVVNPVDTIPGNVYEYWSSSLTDHLYTTNSTDPRTSYAATGTPFKIFRQQAFGTIPIYSFWNSQDGDHLYSKNNVASIGNGLWLKEGIAFYAYDTPGSGRIPVYEYWSGQSTDHYYTTQNSPTISGQWSNSGIAFYVPL